MFEPDTEWHLARASHEGHRDDIHAGSPAASTDFDDLDPQMLEANLDHVRFIPTLLRALGMDVAEGAHDGTVPPLVLTDEEVETGARLEHLRWARLTRRQGRHGHDDLVPWDELDEVVRERDRVRVRAIPELLASVGRVVERAPDGPTPG